MTKRRMTPARRKRILERDGHACRICSCTEGPFEIDHHLPIWLGGSDDDENLRTLCLNCHKGETKAGTKARAKGNRIRAKLNGKRRAKHKIQSRDFPKPPPGYKPNWPKRKLRGRGFGK